MANSRVQLCQRYQPDPSLLLRKTALTPLKRLARAYRRISGIAFVGIALIAVAAQSAPAAIIVQGQRASIDLFASALGGQTGDGDQQQINHFAPQGFTKFTNSDSANASNSGNNGSATGRSTGSTNTSFTLSNDELSLSSNTSFQTIGSFSPSSYSLLRLE